MKNEIAALKKQFVSKLRVLPYTLEKAAQLLQEFPLTSAELQDVVPLTKNNAANTANGNKSLSLNHTGIIELKKSSFYCHRSRSSC